MSFQIALSQVTLTLLYILPGYLLSKTKKASAQHLSTLSAILIYVCGPCMHISAFISKDFSWETLRGMALFFVVTFVLQSAFMALLYFLFRSKQGDARFRILNIGSTLGNVGFFGLPVIRALLPDHSEAACYSAIYCVTMNILVFTMGVFCLTKEKKYMSLKSALVNPTMIGFYIAMPLFMLSARQRLPEMLVNGVKLVGDMSTPFCMIILGIRLAQTPVKKLFTQPFVYAVSLAKLVAFPLFCFVLVYFLPLSMAFKASVLVLSATPCASIILNLAEMHHSEMDLSANCVLVSTLLCFLTIPVMTLLV
ncbi:MAG: AEC family transporter [Clostridia bacterium]|nr:AEC family transporter [Clostridia bacterium]